MSKGIKTQKASATPSRDSAPAVFLLKLLLFIILVEFSYCIHTPWHSEPWFLCFGQDKNILLLPTVCFIQNQTVSLIMGVSCTVFQVHTRIGFEECNFETVLQCFDLTRSTVVQLSVFFLLMAIRHSAHSLTSAQIPSATLILCLL